MIDNSGPFPGQRPYRSSESALFAGRDGEVREVASLWRQNRLTILRGNGGVGKSSLVQAGLLPAVTTHGVDVLPVGRVTDNAVFPEAGLFEHNRHTLSLLSSWASSDARSRLSRMSLPSFLERRKRQLGRTATLIAVDQAEELFQDAGDGKGQREQFLAELAAAMNEHREIRLLFVIRSEYVPDLLAESPLVPDAIATLSALGADAAAEVIWRPFALAGRSIAPDVAEAIVAELTDRSAVDADLRPSALSETEIQPALLQAVGGNLWRMLSVQSGELNLSRNLNRIDIDQYLTSFVAAGVAAVACEYDIVPARLIDWFARAFLPSRTATVSADESSHGTGQRLAVLRALEDRHVLRAVPGSYGLKFTLSSERLRAAIQVSALSAAASGFELSALDNLTAAGRALTAGEFARASQRASEALRTSQAADLRMKADAETVLGNIAFERAARESAIEHYTSAASLYEALQDSVSVGHLLGAIGRLHLLSRKPVQAVSALHSANNRLRIDSAVLLDLARAFASAGESFAAVATLGSALYADPDVGGDEAHLLRAEILADLGDSVGALRDLEQLSHCEALSASAARALSLAQLGMLDDADERIGQALAAGRDNGPVLLRAAQIRVLHGDTAGAEQLLREAFEATEPQLTQYQVLRANAVRDGLAA